MSLASRRMLLSCAGSGVRCCRKKMQELMKRAEEKPEDFSKTEKIKAQVAEVKGVMKGNIEKVVTPAGAPVFTSLCAVVVCVPCAQALTALSLSASLRGISDHSQCCLGWPGHLLMLPLRCASSES